MDLKAILFDLDGTLLDSLPVYEEVFAEIFGKVGLKRPERRLVRRLIASNVSPWDYLKEVGIDPEIISKAQDTDKILFPRIFVKRAKPFPQAIDLVRELKKHFLLGIVTSGWFDGAMLKVVSSLDIETVVTKKEVKVPKPNPEGLLFASNKLGVPPALTAYVGDTPQDMMAANAANMRAIGVLWGVGTKEALEMAGAEKTVGSFEELGQLFL